MAEEQFCLRCNNHQQNFISVFTHLLRTESLVDVTLAAEGKHLQAHRVVLSACSPYFQMLFTMNSCQHPIVILTDIKYSHLKIIVDFMYYGEVNISQEQLPAILKAAELLEVKGLPENKRLQESSTGSGSGSTGSIEDNGPPPAADTPETGSASEPLQVQAEEVVAGPVEEQGPPPVAQEPEQVQAEEELAGPVEEQGPPPIAQEPEQVQAEEELAGPVEEQGPPPIAQVPQKLPMAQLLAAAAAERRQQLEQQDKSGDAKHSVGVLSPIAEECEIEEGTLETSGTRGAQEVLLEEQSAGPVEEQGPPPVAQEPQEVQAEEVVAGPVEEQGPPPVAQEPREVQAEEVVAGPVEEQVPPPIAQELEIQLVDWCPILEAGNLHFEGLRYFRGSVMRYVTAAVKARVGQGQSCSHVRLTDGNTCHLLGELRDDNNRVPDEIKRKFYNGVPRCWRHYCSEWTKNKANASSVWDHETLKAAGIKTSKRGRPQIRCLKHWLGEDSATYIKQRVKRLRLTEQ